MTQRVFDTDNEKDMNDLWDILPEGISRIVTRDVSDELILWSELNYKAIPNSFFKIEWHGKCEICRPNLATLSDIGKLCYFWAKDNDYTYGILTSIDVESDEYHFVVNGEIGYPNCRRLTKQEIKELC